jgi:hypothetical protein
MDHYLVSFKIKLARKFIKEEEDSANKMKGEIQNLAIRRAEY